ncbi:HlyD family secretion protein [Qipengyuania qiaonensis]|uniref:HlyD family secretion protein n=1 Tax=Qipengyuania qiaonensis TaxID=2867240 RepID=A0ABS7J6T3_9SPHN|nr:HlyD family secretion protein [Qipengyuania qiaonensis]MBX7481695.1 HlyD family secretion protein [Qipengyuania qiaonensis]
MTENPDPTSPDADAPPEPKASPLSSPRTRVVLGVVLLGLLAGALAWGWSYWTSGRFMESTNNAYLAADSVTLAPRVSGYLDQVLVDDNESVRAGQIVARIEAGPFEAALAEAEADLAARRADLLRIEAELRARGAATDEARARLAVQRSAASLADREAQRASALAQNGAGTRERSDAANAERDQARARVRAEEAAVRTSAETRSTLTAQLAQAEAAIAAAEARVASARLDLEATELRAPRAGRIGDNIAEAGQYVQPGTRLMTVVPTGELYITANFKETQLGRIRPGQPVRIEIDAFAGGELTGVVDSLAPGTGATFALLPPENATGNFTKIVQRVPVRIMLRLSAEQRARLAPGLSAEVTVDTREARR